MSITGNLRTLELSELLQWLAQGRKTGVLVVDDGRIEKRIYFDSGKITCSESSDPAEHLGTLLIREGHIDQATLSRAVKLQEATQILLGKVLVSLGSISEEELNRVLKLKTEESIFELFTWPEGEFRFLPDQRPRLPMVPLALEVTNIVLEGMKRLDEQREAAGSSIMEPQAPHPQDFDSGPGGDLFDTTDSDSELGPQELELDESPHEAVLEAPSLEASATKQRSSPEMRGFYQTIPSRSGGRKPLLAAAAVIAAVALGGGAYFFLRPQPAAGINERLGTESSRTIEDLSLSTSSAVATRPEGDRGLMEMPLPEPPEVEQAVAELANRIDQPGLDKAQRSKYESELAALRQQLEETRRLAAERQAAVEAMRAAQIAETTPTKLESEPPKRLAETVTVARTGTELEVSDPSATAGGDEPPSLAATLPASTRLSDNVSPDLSDSIVDIAPATQPPATPRASEKTSASPVAKQPAAPKTADQTTVSKATPQPAVSPGDLVVPGPGVTPPVMQTRPNPRYPQAAVRLRKEADVTVRLLIDENGEVAEAVLSGTKAGFGFDQAALAAAQETVWEPATKNGVPVRIWTELRIAFRQ